MRMQNMTREQKIAAYRKEIADLKAELKKTNNSHNTAVIWAEIRDVAKKLVRLEEAI